MPKRGGLGAAPWSEDDPERTLTHRYLEMRFQIGYRCQPQIIDPAERGKQMARQPALNQILLLEANFIDLLLEIFRRDGFNVTKRLERNGPDAVVEKDGERTVIEVKLHRSQGILVRNVADAYYVLNKFMRFENAKIGLLVITLSASALRAPPEGIFVWGTDEIASKISAHPDLQSRFAELLRALQVGAEHKPDTSSASIGERALDVGLPQAVRFLPGAEIIKNITALKPGKDDAANFERLCEQALRLMFGTEFFGWVRQNEIDEGFHRTDLIARLVPTRNPFWSTLAADFRTRYVIFEFKNYSDPISQDQIYTTEKYLFTAALRSTALIVARNGVSESAQKACRGSLREQGKLILWISLEDLCEMLTKQDSGGDPTDTLYVKLDELLMTIAR